MRTIRELAQAVDPALKRVDGLVRRMAVTLAGAKAIWQFSGFRQLDGSTETVKAEVFGGIGVYARPPASGKPEAVVIMVGDSKVPVAVAVRDEKTRAAIAGALDADETALFNSQAMVHITDGGKVEVRSKNGTAAALPTMADFEALVATFNAHVHGGVVAGSYTSLVPTPLAGAATGTTVLKGE